MRDEIDGKASMHDLGSLQSNLMEKLNELVGNLEGMFADKDATRKKTAALEKAVSFNF
jgi:phage FluMu protein gp41